MLPRRARRTTEQQSRLTESVFEVVLQKSIPAQIRQLILFDINDKGYADGFVGELTFCESIL